MKRFDVSKLAIAALGAGALLMGAPVFANGGGNAGQPMHHRMFHMGSPMDNTTGAVTNDMSSATAVFLGGTPIMRFRVAAGGYSPEQRADATQQRLNRLLGEGPIYASDITVAAQGDDAVVMVKGQLMFTADAATASFNTCTPVQLAQIWADNLRHVLPPLTAPH